MVMLLLSRFVLADVGDSENTELVKHSSAVVVDQKDLSTTQYVIVFSELDYMMAALVDNKDGVLVESIILKSGAAFTSDRAITELMKYGADWQYQNGGDYLKSVDGKVVVFYGTFMGKHALTVISTKWIHLEEKI